MRVSRWSKSLMLVEQRNWAGSGGECYGTERLMKFNRSRLVSFQRSGIVLGTS